MATVFGTLFLVVAINLTAHVYLQTHPVNLGITRLWQKWHMLEALNEPYDWIVLGDSSCGQGLSEAVLSERLGGSVGNFCTIANAGVVNDAWLLERYIERFGAPRGVIVMHVFHVWDRTSADLVTMFDQIPLTGRFWRHLEPPIQIGAWHELRLQLSPITTLFDKNLSVSAVMQRKIMQLFDPVGTKTSSAQDELAFVMRHNGFIREAKPNIQRVLTDTQKNREAFGGKTFMLDPSNRAALEAMVAVSARFRLPIYISNTSIAAPLYDDLGIQRYFSELQATIRPIVLQSPYARFILSVPPTFPPEQMDNIDHVVGETAIARLSNDVADAIEELQ